MGISEVTGGNGRFVALDRAECLALLRGGRVGRVAFSHRAVPAVVPVTYVLDGDVGILLRIRRGTPLASVVANVVVAFEVDDASGVDEAGWSVTVVGHAREPTDDATRGRLWSSPPRVGPGDGDHLARIAIEALSGRRTLPAAATPLSPARRHPAA